MTAISYHQPRRPHFLKRGQIAVYVSLLVAVLQGVARGAALELYETGAPDLGTASAGRAAMAADASTAATNLAGMTLLDRSQLMWASGALLPSTNFDIGPQTTTKGAAGGNAGVFIPRGGVLLCLQALRADWPTHAAVLPVYSPC
jgi:long-subunit fatty acid transport protein